MGSGIVLNPDGVRNVRSSPVVRRLALEIAVRVDDPVDLRFPGVCCDQDTHQDVTDATGTLEALD